jgi:RHS repeat-associated protein
VWNRCGAVSYYAHEVNKNVSEVVAENGEVVAHYEYTPFGAFSVQHGASAMSNPWRFASEVAEDETATIYYNYRHYEPVVGRWLRRDPLDEIESCMVYCIWNNNVNHVDCLGLMTWSYSGHSEKFDFTDEEVEETRK